MIDPELLITELRGVVAVTCPEVVAHGIYEAERAQRIGLADIPCPYVTMRIPALPGDSPAAGTLRFTPTVEIYYVCGWDGNSAPLRARVLALMRAFWPVNPLTAATVTGVPVVGWSDPTEHNTLFANRGAIWMNLEFLRQNAPMRAGLVELALALQETP